MEPKRTRKGRKYGKRPRAISHSRALTLLGIRKLERLSKPDGDCLIWQGNIGTGGYGRLRIDGDLFMVHRLAKSLASKVPYPGLHVHHLCHRRACVNPEHLQIVTIEQHAEIHAREKREAPECQRGHSMDDAYLRPDTGARQCRGCIRDRHRKTYDRYRATIWQAAPPRDCNVCGKTFYPRNRNAERCGQKCRMAAFLERRKAELAR